MLQRLWLYLKEMYPPIPSFLIAVVSVYNLYFMLQILQGQPQLQIDTPSVGGALTLFFFLLFLRISDELKDLETDKVLFPERLVPSGKVLVSDLKVLMAVSVIVMWALNLFVTGVPLAFGVLFGFGVLMFFYFGLRDVISQSLLLALITHNPSVLIMNFYVIAIYAQQFQQPLWTPRHFFLAALFWIPGLCWELARKIRAPQDEDDYETYSKIFGYRLASALPCLALLVHYGMIVSLTRSLNLSGLFLGALTLALLAVLGFFGRFLRRPNAQTSRLKPVLEAYMLVSALGLFLDMLLQREVAWLIGSF